MTHQDTDMEQAGMPLTSVRARGWTASDIERGTGGHWSGDAPGLQWRAMGICIVAAEMQPGDVVAVRGKDNVGIAPANIPKLPFTPQALILDSGASSVDCAAPELRVNNVRAAVLRMGAYARKATGGKVIGVTGSAGKTTMVAMLSHVLGLWGPAGRSRASANLQVGISWNLASMPRNAAFLVVEMAIGGMRNNTGLARPDLAIVTNVAPAHLEYHSNVDEIARRKAVIFGGMAPGGVAVIFSDMPQFEIFAAAAREARLRIVTYGRHEGADVRLICYAPGRRLVEVEVRGRRMSFVNGAPGEHMALNAAGCLAVLDALGLPVEAAGPFFSLFLPMRGRGETTDITVDGRHIRIIDEAYNANPASMAAAMQLVREIAPPSPAGRRVLVLGDMLELGPESPSHHAQLKQHVEGCGPDLVILCGEQMASLRDVLDEKTAPVVWFPNAQALLAGADALLRDGDLLLVKSSAGTRLSDLVRVLKTPRAIAPAARQSAIA